jgi:DHA1 family multidrug resistance protein-like MFS transporter
VPMEKRILLTLLLVVFAAFLGVGIIIPIMSIYAMDLGATGITLGLMISAFSISQGILQPVVGNLSDRRGRKRFLVVGLLIYAVVGLIYTLATSVEHLILIRIFQGVGSAMILPIVMAYIGDLAPQGQEGKYMGMLNIAIFAGIGVGPMLGGLFLDTIGINPAFYAMSALTAASLGLVLVLLPPERSDREVRLTAGLLTTFRRMLHNSRVVGMLLPRIATVIVMIPTMGFLPILMDRLMGATGIEIGIVISARTIVNAGLQTTFGRMADRYNKVALLLIGCSIASAGMFVVPFANSFLQLVGLFALIGIGEALVWPTLGAIAVEEGHQYGQGSMMGIFNMAISAGILIGSLLAGLLMDLLGLRYVFYIISVILILSALVGGPMIARGGQAQEEDSSVDSGDD